MAAQEPLFVDPKTDIVFKRLFGTEENKPLLLSLLNAVLQYPEGEKLESVELLNPFVLGEYPEDKIVILDVRAKDQTGRLYNVEIQCGPQGGFSKRVLYYWARLYSSQLLRGKSYLELRRTISIVFVDFTLFDETEGYHSVFQLREKEEGFLLNKALEIHVLELPKYALSAANAKEPLEQWMCFLKEGNQMEHEHIEFLSQELKKALKEIEHLSQKEEFRHEYEARYKGLMDFYAGYIGQFQEGVEKGKEIGRKIGMELGREEGMELGREEGMELGREEGMELGREEGMELGREEGMELGRVEGERAGLLKSAKRLVERGMAPEEVVELLGISEAELFSFELPEEPGAI